MSRPLALLFCLVAAGLATTVRAQPQRPDVVFIALDDLNDWITLLNPSAPIATPNLERLAKRGVSFSRAYAAS
ncbi:MAG TPA: hypothetical protein VGE76_07390, partial [Opitutaceae bacterium]